MFHKRNCGILCCQDQGTSFLYFLIEQLILIWVCNRFNIKTIKDCSIKSRSILDCLEFSTLQAELCTMLAIFSIQTKTWCLMIWWQFSINKLATLGLQLIYLGVNSKLCTQLKMFQGVSAFGNQIITTFLTF